MTKQTDMFPVPPRVFSKKLSTFWFLLGDEADDVLDVMQRLERPCFNYHHIMHDVWWNVLAYRIVRILEAPRESVLDFFLQEPHRFYVTSNPLLAQTEITDVLLAIGTDVRMCNPSFSFEGLSVRGKAVALKEEILG